MPSIQNENKTCRSVATDSNGKPRPHSTHLEFDDVTIQLIRLRQENAELKESLRLEKKECTKLRALNDELGFKLEEHQREAREAEATKTTKVGS